MPKSHLATTCVHAGETPENYWGAVTTPIFATSTYQQKSPGQHQGYEYSRTKNPTRAAFENAVAALENADYGFAFASGMAAIATVLDLLPAGSHIIASDDLYGGTHRLFKKVREFSANLSFSLVDTSDVNHIKNAINQNTRLIWIESPTNPLLKLSDLNAIAAIARQHKILSVVDNTFATPFCQQPLNFGFDIAIHSATKYINGHSDVIAGVIVTQQKELAEKIHFLQNSVGAILSPFDSYLALRGLKTFYLRMEKHCQNALEIADWLEKQPWVETVIYPGLTSHPQQHLAKQQMKHFGGIISFYLRADAKKFLENCRLFTLAESLGGVESLIELPAIMTHASLAADIRQQLKITDNLVRISVGIENVDDLKADLEQAALL